MVSGKSQKVRIESGAEEAWYYEDDRSIHIVVWPENVPSRYRQPINLHISRSQLLKYIERSGRQRPDDNSEDVK